MISVPRGIPFAEEAENQAEYSRIERLKDKINSEDYLYEAIQRIAQILSNEILGIPQGGISYERQRKGRK
jgi:hypothetical protein